ncbi:PepSY domain-containing protein [Lentibacillus sp. CBA3610]|uniref:PepSY domain-containing protein n=1 Tax=Lentibacillus sp. CBA3610 TaxID=2518176 RepID=UPI00159570E1|nr:PepSY domain-containing protein [Lentibacillus sp. CBA3610]QKY71196.1 hypothetical protein Len3610_17970 [Lentibacillus sp. CBA3610]
MKKKIGLVLTVILGISALGLGMFQSSASEASPSMDRQEIEDVINAQYPGEITELELDKKGSRSVYEAEIQDGNTEYEIKLDGNTGDVLELEEKFVAKDNHKQNGQSSADSNDEKSGQTDNDQNKSNQNNGENARNNDNADANNSLDNDNTDRMELNRQGNSDDNKESGNQAVISTAEAEEIALNEFSGTITEMELDEDDGRLYYEIEMKSENKEAELEIDAYTSEILVMEIDSEDDDDDDDDDRYDD